jgi:hypothetical protein
VGHHGAESGTEWARALYRFYWSTMPYEVQAARDDFVIRGEWDVVAAGVLDWAMQNERLTAEHKVQALKFAQAGMFGRSSAYFEHRLSAYRPPIGPTNPRH